MNADETITVTIRTRNRANYLRVAVESVIAQTYQEWKLLISDDGSTDETPNVGRYFEQFDSRIKYIRHDPALGASNNWRFCLANSQGKYFAALDDDNRYLPNFLEKAIAAFEVTTDISFVFSDEWRIDEVGNRDEPLSIAASNHYHRTGLASGICKDIALISAQQAHSINASVFVREKLNQIGGFRKLAGDFADFDLFLNLASCGHQAAYISERLVEYRQHGNQDAKSYLRSVEKAHSAISILESVTFTGLAEQERIKKLAQAYVTLSRTLLLNGDTQAARKAIAEALQIQPINLRTRLFMTILLLPNSLLQYGIKYRYGK